MVNRSIILECLRTNQPVSRADISRITGLTPGTVSNIVSMLIEEGIVVEKGVGKASSKGGKRPIYLYLNSDVCYVVGLEIRSDYVQGGIVDLGGNIVAAYKKPTSDFGVWASPERVISDILRFIDEVIYRAGTDRAGIERTKIAAIGLGVHGVVDTQTGRLLFSPHFPFLEGADVGSIISRKLGLPVVMENDARAESLAEKMSGPAQRVDNVLIIHVDAGIGCGVFLNGELYRGMNGMAGEIGHIIVDQDGPRCVCGNYGCLEAMAGGRAIVRRVVSELERGTSSRMRDLCNGNLDIVTINMVAQAALDGDELACRAINHAGRYIGLALATFITLFDPELVIVQGEMAQAREVLLDPIIEMVDRSVPRRGVRRTRIMLGENRGNYAILGPALLALRNEHEQPESAIASRLAQARFAL
ncbi:MAG: ROK family transcriptional regulator [Firmicutes bacterium]|nr:ROK family transcriptional regulator [Bacillota bacterium]